MFVEIRAAEGGADAKDLVLEQLGIYARYCSRLDLAAGIVDERPGAVTLEVDGKNAARAFRHEPGGHRWQRVPPSERHGRRHTSTITVAVLPVIESGTFTVDDRDIEWKAIRGSGNGGQARNKTSNCVVMKHLPTGTTVRVETERSQWQNRESARRLLQARLASEQEGAAVTQVATDRRQQVGSGERGDKRRTVRMQDGQVTDHVTGKRMGAARYLRGFVDDLH